MSIQEKILKDIDIMEANYIYRKLKEKEQLSDDDIALFCLEIISNNLEQLNNNNLIVLSDLLKLAIDNNLSYLTKKQIEEKLNNILLKECPQNIYLLLDNLRSFVNCIFKNNNNEQRLRNFYEEQLKQNEREIANLHKLISKKDKKIRDLEKKEKNNNRKLTEKKKNLQEKEKQLLKLKRQVISDDVLTVAQISKVKDYFLKYLEEPRTEYELRELARELNLNEQDFNKIFEMLNQEYNIASNVLTFPKYYQIMPLKPNKKETFLLPPRKDEIDILMIADLHIRNISNYLRSLMYVLNNYAIKNNISYSFILGDLFDIRWEDLEKGKYDFIKAWEKNAFQVKREFDKSSLNYLILGGNHDERALVEGIDLLKYLENNCSNVKGIGYQDASVVFGEVKKVDNNIGLHHTGKHLILPKPVFITEFENRQIKGYLNNYYQNDDKSYFDFFGHFHFDYLNLKDGYALINNFPNATSSIKAYHLKFYLNEKGNINNMVIKLLSIYCNEFLANNEYNYQKVRKR